MENNKPENVPYVVYEAEAAKHERTVKRLIIALIISILMIVGSNMAWLWVFNQYDICSEEYIVEDTVGSNTNMLGAGASVNGVIDNGKNGNEKEDND